MKITIVPNGPILIDTVGEWTWDGEGTPIRKKDRLALCRCGASASRPFCDGSHRRIGFEAPGGSCELTPRET